MEVPKSVHPFTYHQARWSEALKNLSSAHEQARNAAVGHIHEQIVSAAQGAGMDPNHVGTFWYKDRPHISVLPGTKTEELEYGNLDRAPQATIRNAARRADRQAAKIYHSTLWRGIGL
jgi:hypothetical protein